MTRRYWMAGTGLGPHRVGPTLLLDPRRFTPYAKASQPHETACHRRRTLSTISIDDSDPIGTSWGALWSMTQELLGELPIPIPEESSNSERTEQAPIPPEVPVRARDQPLLPVSEQCNGLGVRVPPRDGQGHGLKRQRTREGATAPLHQRDPSGKTSPFKTFSLTEDQLYLSAKVTGSKPTPLYLLVPGSDMPTTLPIAARHWNLSFGELLGRGRLGSAYRATLSPVSAGLESAAESPSISLIAKLMVLSPEVHLHNGKPRSDAYPDAGRALDAAWDEAEIYGRLAPIQGDFVPYYYGLLSTKEDDHTHLIALMSDAGDALEDDRDSPGLYHRDKIRDVYHRLHREFLVLHIDVGARHIRLRRRGREERIILIDFEASMARTEDDEEVDDDDWEWAIENEIKEVEPVLANGMAKS